MKNILIVSGHPDLKNNSFANKIIVEDLEKALPSAKFSYLDRLYPDYKIDVSAEQAKLVAADIIVLEFPIFWYSMPALLAKWMEEVFVHGFSHGSTGKALVGKKFLVAFTTGAPAEAYGEGSPMLYPVSSMATRFEQTAALCGMDYVGYIVTSGVSYASRADETKIAAMTAASHEHAERIVNKLKELS